MKFRIWEIKGGKYEKTIVKILIGAIFSYARYPEKCFTQIYRDLYGDAMMMPIQIIGHQHGGRKLRETLVRKREFISR